MLKPRYSQQATLTRRRKNFSKWFSAATAKYKDYFSYLKAEREYRTQKNPMVTIICKKHQQVFKVTPYDHLRYLAGGCPDCEHQVRSESKLESGEIKFKEWFSENLADRLDLLTPFKGMTKELTLLCRIHKTTHITKPTLLMHEGNWGCIDCGRESRTVGGRLADESIRNELEHLMPDGVRIVGVIFNEGKRSSFVKIECTRHGFHEVAAGYLRNSRHKCPRCGDEETGYAANRLRKLLESNTEGYPTWIGLMEIEVFGIQALKVGITRRGLEERYRWYLRKVFYSIRIKEIDAIILENRIHKAFKEHQDQRILKAGMRGGKRWPGDTECYWFDQKNNITIFIKDFIEKLKMGREDYQREIENFERFSELGNDVKREKDLKNKPRAVICIETNQTFSSIAEAARVFDINHGNLSMVLAGRRRLAGGVRWAYAEDYERIAQQPLRERVFASKKVKCIETEEVFISIAEAARQKGISNSHITSVCKGKRITAGGLHWEYVTE